MAGPTVKFVGAAELRVGLRRLGDGADDPDVARRGAELVADEVRERTPVDSGDLVVSIRVEQATPSAAVVAGSPSIPYAGVQEYGWPARNIDAQHYMADAADESADDVTDIYAEHVGGLVIDVGEMTR